MIVWIMIALIDTGTGGHSSLKVDNIKTQADCEAVAAVVHRMDGAPSVACVGYRRAG